MGRNKATPKFGAPDSSDCAQEQQGDGRQKMGNKLTAQSRQKGSIANTQGKPVKDAEKRSTQAWFTALAKKSTSISTLIAKSDDKTVFLQELRRKYNNREQSLGDGLVKHLEYVHCLSDSSKNLPEDSDSDDCRKDGGCRTILDKLIEEQINVGKTAKKSGSSTKTECSVYFNRRKSLFEYILTNHCDTHYIDIRTNDSALEQLLDDDVDSYWPYVPKELVQCMVTIAPKQTAQRIDSWFTKKEHRPSIPRRIHRLIGMISTIDESGISALAKLIPELSKDVLRTRDSDAIRLSELSSKVLNASGENLTILHFMCTLPFTGEHKKRHKDIVEILVARDPDAVTKLTTKTELSPYRLRKDIIKASEAGTTPQEQEADEVANYLKKMSLCCETYQETEALIFGTKSHTVTSSVLRLDLDYLTDPNFQQPIPEKYLMQYLKMLDLGDMLKFVRIPHVKLAFDPEELEDDTKSKKEPTIPEIIFSHLTTRNPPIRTILEVIVKDAPGTAPGSVTPDTNASIKTCLQPFKDTIQKWDWQKVDICLATVHEIAPNLRQLHLYTSANKGVLYHWASKDGIAIFQHLQTVYLTICPNYVVETQKDIAAHIEEFQSTVQKNLPKIDFHCDYEKESAPQDSVDVHSKSLGNTEKHINILPEDVWLAEMKEFGQFVRKFGRAKSNIAANLKPKPVRVAVLDDGFTLMDALMKEGFQCKKLTTASFHAKQTKSFPMTELYSKSGHGTLMTELIYMMCPDTEFYIAKLEQIENGPHTVAAVEAIKWAISKNVDIISMSWTIKSRKGSEAADFKELRSAIRKAKEKKIMMFGAATDQGKHISRDDVILPGSADGVFFIGAADTSGNADRHVEKDVAFILPGGDQGKYKGSSYATALAAGLAALILHCAEIAGFFEKHEKLRKSDWSVEMEKIWDKMSVGGVEGRRKYVQPGQLLRVEKFKGLQWNPEHYKAFKDVVDMVLAPVLEGTL